MEASLLIAATLSTMQMTPAVQAYRGDKDKKWTFLQRMDYSSTRRLQVLGPVSF